MAQAFAVASCVASPLAETVQPTGVPTVLSVVVVLLGLFAEMLSIPAGVDALPPPPVR
jgi:hypothetical protein